MPDIRWRDDMQNAPRDGTTFLAYFPLTGLHDSWCRVVPIYWAEGSDRWNFASRAASGFSKGHEPSHWAKINAPTHRGD